MRATRRAVRLGSHRQSPHYFICFFNTECWRSFERLKRNGLFRIGSRLLREPWQKGTLFRDDVICACYLVGARFSL